MKKSLWCLLFALLSGVSSARYNFYNTSEVDEEFELMRTFLAEHIGNILERVDNSKLTDKKAEKIMENIDEAVYMDASAHRKCKRIWSIPYEKGKSTGVMKAPGALGIERLFYLPKEHRFFLCYDNFQNLYQENSFCAMSALVVSAAARTRYKILPSAILKAVNSLYGDLELATIEECKAAGMTHKLR